MISLLLATVLSCPITITDGVVSGTCITSPITNPVPLPVPTPTPTPTPTPAPSNCAFPSNGKLQPIFAGGSNNYAYDSFGYTNSAVHGGPNPGASAPAGSIQIYSVPTAFQSGTGIVHGNLNFSDTPAGNWPAHYEVSFSKCPGDFETYKTIPDGYGGTACGGVFGNVFNLLWSREPVHYYNECYIPPSEGWYINWRALDCKAIPGYTCGQVFTIPQS